MLVISFTYSVGNCTVGVRVIVKYYLATVRVIDVFCIFVCCTGASNAQIMGLSGTILGTLWRCIKMNVSSYEQSLRSSFWHATSINQNLWDFPNRYT